MTLELSASGTARKPAPRTAVAVARSAAGRFLPPGAVLALAAWLRFRQLTAVGFNSDEAVYTGSAQALSGHTGLESMFPVFRAHPILVQLIIAQALRISDSDWSARAVTAGFGVVTVGLTYLLGRRLYGRATGCTAAGLLAVMPYHVVVSREVLLDGPMTCFGVLCLYCLARATEDAPRRWAMAAGAALGLSPCARRPRRCGWAVCSSSGRWGRPDG
ncbi:glycosyltransferase family 39 protein [Streptacidiphilus sp. 4-A2]|nr:glycosyltransferase family 39 protein [Streptacidiphilus sp. 4-A2]